MKPTFFVNFSHVCSKYIVLCIIKIKKSILVLAVYLLYVPQLSVFGKHLKSNMSKEQNFPQICAFASLPTIFQTEL